MPSSKHDWSIRDTFLQTQWKLVFIVKHSIFINVLFLPSTYTSFVLLGFVYLLLLEMYTLPPEQRTEVLPVCPPGCSQEIKLGYKVKA